MDQPSKKRSRCKHNSTASQQASVSKFNMRDPTIGDADINHLTLDNLQRWLRFNRQLHRLTIKFAIRLRPRPTHRRALASIEKSELDAGVIGNPAHQSIQRINFTYKVPFAKAADRRITGHDPDRIGRNSNQCSRGTSTRGSGSGLATRVSTTNHNNIETLRHIYPSKLRRCRESFHVKHSLTGVPGI